MSLQNDCLLNYIDQLPCKEMLLFISSPILKKQLILLLLCVLLLLLTQAAGRWDAEEFSVRGNPMTGEVTAVYTKDGGETKVEMKITMPASYPLANVRAECSSKVGITSSNASSSSSSSSAAAVAAAAANGMPMNTGGGGKEGKRGGASRATAGRDEAKWRRWVLQLVQLLSLQGECWCG